MAIFSRKHFQQNESDYAKSSRYYVEDEVEVEEEESAPANNVGFGGVSLGGLQRGGIAEKLPVGDKALDVSKQYGVSIAFNDLDDNAGAFHVCFINTGDEVNIFE